MKAVNGGPDSDPLWLVLPTGGQTQEMTVTLAHGERGWAFVVDVMYVVAGRHTMVKSSTTYELYPEEVGDDSDPTNVLESIGHALVEVAKALRATNY